MKREEFLGRARRLLASQLVGTLGTVYEGSPHQALVAYVYSSDLRELFFVTRAYTRKVEAMRANPRVSLLVDDRQNLASDFASCTVVTARGTAALLPAERHAHFLTQYRERHPYLVDFLTSPTSAYYRIQVRSYSLVSDFQRVDELVLA